MSEIKHVLKNTSLMSTLSHLAIQIDKCLSINEIAVSDVSVSLTKKQIHVTGIRPLFADTPVDPQQMLWVTIDDDGLPWLNGFVRNPELGQSNHYTTLLFSDFYHSDEHLWETLGSYIYQ